MAWWIKSILIGVLSLGLALPGAASPATGEPSTPPTYGDSHRSAPPLPIFPIVPELTSPAETPVAEASPKPMTWFTEAVATEPAGANKAGLDPTLEQWLAWLKTFWTDR